MAKAKKQKQTGKESGEKLYWEVHKKIVPREDVVWEGKTLTWEGNRVYSKGAPIYDEREEYPVEENSTKGKNARANKNKPKPTPLLSVEKDQVKTLDFLHAEPTVRSQDEIAAVFKPAKNLKTVKIMLDDMIKKGLVAHPKKGSNKGYVLTDFGKQFYNEHYT